MAVGVLQVARHTFVRALKEKGAVMLCPGGQAELLHCYRAFKQQREFVLHIGHKGFCKLAIEHGAAVVPVLALGETLQLRNIFDVPTLQQLTYKRLGFPFPYMLVGRWGCSPFPKKVPLVYVVGKPLRAPEYPEGRLLHYCECMEQQTAVVQRCYTSFSQLYCPMPECCPSAAAICLFKANCKSTFSTCQFSHRRTPCALNLCNSAVCVNYVEF